MTHAPTVAGRRPRSPRGQGDLLRGEILAAAERILVETSDQSALSVRAVASAVGVTPPSIYLHFADRNELVFAVCERQAARLRLVMDEAARDGCDAWDRIARRGRAYLEWGLQNREHYRVLMMGRPDSTPDRFMDARLGVTAGLAAVAADFELLAGAGPEGRQFDPGRQAELLWMLVHGMVSLLISKPAYPFADLDTMFASALDVFRRALLGGA